MYIMDFCIAIPSYNRSALFLTKTYNVLRLSGLLDKTSVFVVPEEEQTYKDLCPDVRIVVGVKGLPEQLRFIDAYYPVGTKVMRMDDDIDFLVKKDGSKTYDVSAVVAEGFAEMSRVGANMWGIYPVANPYFMRDGYSHGLAFCIGCFCGWVAGVVPGGYIPTRGNKEDVYRSCGYFKRDGVIVRRNDIAVSTKFRRGDSLTATKELHDACADEIVADFPEYATKYYRKKSGWAEVRLKRLPRLALPTV